MKKFLPFLISTIFAAVIFAAAGAKERQKIINLRERTAEVEKMRDQRRHFNESNPKED